MNAPPTMPRPPIRSDYESIVRAMRPHCQGEEMLLRSSLLLMRDRAAATKPIACESAWALLDVVEREATNLALRELSIDDLRELRRLCVMCVAHASSFDAFHLPRPAPEQGEAASAKPS